MKNKFSLWGLILVLLFLLTCAPACGGGQPGPKYDSPNEAAEKITVSLQGKTDMDGSDLYHVPEEISFTVFIEDRSNYVAEAVQGVLSVYNKEGTLLCSLTLPSKGWSEPRNRPNQPLVLTANDLPDQTRCELYYTSITQLRATFEITSVSFKKYASDDSFQLLYPDRMPPVLEALALGSNSGSVDSSELSFRQAAKVYALGAYEQALELFEAIPQNSRWYDKSLEFAARCRGMLENHDAQKRYDEAKNLCAQGKYGEAYVAMKEVGDYLDAAELLQTIYQSCTAQIPELAELGRYAEVIQLLDAMGEDQTSDRYRSYTYAVAGDFPRAVSLGLHVVSFPQGTISIPDNYLADQSNLTAVYFPTSVKSIGAGAFKNCKNLAVIKDNIHEITTIGDSAFEGCSALHSAGIFDEVTHIGASAFRGCSSLENATFDAKLSSIGEYAFADCSRLTSVTLHDYVTSIREGTFQNCTNLSSVTFSNFLGVIGTAAFKGCVALESIDLPESLHFLEAEAFRDCSNLRGVINIPDRVTTIGAHCFVGCTSLEGVSMVSEGQGWTTNKFPESFVFHTTDSRNNANLLTSVEGYCDATWTKV